MPALPGVPPWDLPPAFSCGPGVARRILDFHLMSPDLEVVRENEESIPPRVGAGRECLGGVPQNEGPIVLIGP
jgi:hypothetical protein